MSKRMRHGDKSVKSVTDAYVTMHSVQILWTPLQLFGSECVCMETASEQPTGHSGLTSKAEEEEEGFKVRRQNDSC